MRARSFTNVLFMTSSGLFGPASRLFLQSARGIMKPSLAAHGTTSGILAGEEKGFAFPPILIVELRIPGVSGFAPQAAQLRYGANAVASCGDSMIPMSLNAQRNDI
jgi:hypothetical protein